MCGTFLFYLREVIDSIPVLMVTREKYVTLKQKEKRERNVKPILLGVSRDAAE